MSDEWRKYQTVEERLTEVEAERDRLRGLLEAREDERERLLAERDRLRAACDQAEAEQDALAAYVKTIKAERGRLRAVVEELRGYLWDVDDDEPDETLGTLRALLLELDTTGDIGADDRGVGGPGVRPGDTGEGTPQFAGSPDPVCPMCRGERIVFKVAEDREGPCSTCGGSGVWPPDAMWLEVTTEYLRTTIEDIARTAGISRAHDDGEPKANENLVHEVMDWIEKARMVEGPSVQPDDTEYSTDDEVRAQLRERAPASYNDGTWDDEP